MGLIHAISGSYPYPLKCKNLFLQPAGVPLVCLLQRRRLESHSGRIFFRTDGFWQFIWSE